MAIGVLWPRKLASSPAVVLLSGMASGAGFSTAENTIYLQHLRGHSDAVLIGIGRVFAALLHISLPLSKKASDDRSPQ